MTCAGITGCDSPESAVRATLARVASAAEHGDRETLFTLHRDSVDGGPFCAPSFERAWGAAGSATPEACAQARAVAGADASEEARLLALTIDFRCSHPEGSCTDLARTAFLKSPRQAPLSSLQVDHIEVRPDGQSAAAHVTLGRREQPPERTVFTLERVGEDWLLTTSAF